MQSILSNKLSLRTFLYFSVTILVGILFTFAYHARAGFVYYFNNAVNTDPAEQGNYWYNPELTDPAGEVPNPGDRLIIVLGSTYNGDAVIGADSVNNGTITGNATFSSNGINDGTVSGDAVFNESSINDGTVSGDAVFNGDASEDNGTVDGVRTRYYTENISTTRDFVTGGSWTITADAVTVDVTGATYDGSTVFNAINGGSFVYPTHTYYFNNAVNTSPATLGNYWYDVGLTDPAEETPGAGDIVNIVSGATYNGTAIFNGGAYNDGTVTGDATFNDTSENHAPA